MFLDITLFLDAVANEFLKFHFPTSLLMYRNTVDFCILLKSTTLLISLTGSSGFFVDYLGCFINTLMFFSTVSLLQGIPLNFQLSQHCKSDFCFLVLIAYQSGECIRLNKQKT